MCRGFRTQVNDYVVNRTLGAAHELCLGMRWPLQVHTAESSAAVIKRNAALGYTWVQTMSCELIRIPRARKESSFVEYAFDRDEKSVCQISGLENHRV